MSRENPHHPGETLLEDCIEALHLTIADAASTSASKKRRWRQSVSAAPQSPPTWPYGSSRPSAAPPTTGSACKPPTT